MDKLTTREYVQKLQEEAIFALEDLAYTLNNYYESPDEELGKINSARAVLKGMNLENLKLGFHGTE